MDAASAHHPLSAYLHAHRERLREPPPLAAQGRLQRVTGLALEVAGLNLPLGTVCEVQDAAASTEAEVVGFAPGRLHLMPTGDLQGIGPGAIVRPMRARMPRLCHREPDACGIGIGIDAGTGGGRRLPMGDALLGRVVDAAGRPIDGRGPIDALPQPLQRKPIGAMERDPVRMPLDVGVRAINALLTVGRGQRVGLFAGSGVGKSVLLGMMARHTQADVTVVGLVGERGREVKEFIEDILGPQGLRRAIVVAAPADLPPLLRMQGASYATAIAEHFRDRGRHVLLLLDSLTRHAMAQREIALALGEPPATKGYPPSVFARLPALVERAGNGPPGGGSITAFYTVLTEGDDPQDPVADSARAILDGHVVLSRSLAEQGHYPAIDVEQSISRVMHAVAEPQAQRHAQRLKALHALYQRQRDLIALGAYVSGADPTTDLAVRLAPRIAAFLQQDRGEGASLEDSVAALAALAPEMHA